MIELKLKNRLDYDQAQKKYLEIGLIDKIINPKLKKRVKRLEKRFNKIDEQTINEFNTQKYLDANKDIQEAIKTGEYDSAMEHYVLFGFNEVQNGTRVLEQETYVKHFDEESYLNENIDIKEAIKNGEYSDAKEHYILYGNDEVKRGTRYIDERSRLENEKSALVYSYDEPIKTIKILKELEEFQKQPLISVIMPVYNVDLRWLNLAIRSIEAQWYDNWEICIADDASTKEETIEFLNAIDNPKIKITFLKKNINISGASNAALKLASGEFIALMDDDDELTSDALYEVVKVINESNAEFIYSDEDKLELDGSYSEPHFKADFAPDMFLSQNYLSHLSVIKKNLIDDVGGWSIGLEGSQDYDLYLKVLERTQRVVHISKVLYHWRKVEGSTAAVFSDKSYAQEAGRVSLQNAMKRRNISATVEDGLYPGTYRVNYDIKDKLLVSIIIPFKDRPELLDMCINSILDKSTYKNYEIIGISNNSEDEKTFSMMEKLKLKDDRVSFYELNIPFNYSAINNYAVEKYANGEQILLLNNDIEIISPEWIESMLEHSQREEVGVVGAKLYYPNGRIQHAGVVIGIGGVAGHSHKYFENTAYGYFSRLGIVQNYSALTAACFMVKKRIFDDINGLDEEHLKIAFNDIDFCLRVREKGYLNLFTPYAQAYHHESISRGQEDNPQKVQRFNDEVDYMLKRHKKILKDGDPFYSKNLTLEHEDFTLKQRVEVNKNDDESIVYTIDNCVKIDERSIFISGWKYSKNSTQVIMHNKNIVKSSIYPDKRDDLKKQKEADKNIKNAGFFGLIEFKEELDENQITLEFLDEVKNQKTVDIDISTGYSVIELSQLMLRFIKIDANVKNIFSDFYGKKFNQLWKNHYNNLNVVPQMKTYGKTIQNPKLSIIIPLYGRVDFMEYQTSLFRTDDAFKNEVELIYVLDDPDEFYDTIDGYAQDIYKLNRVSFKLVKYKNNLGYARANNIGVKYANSSMILLLNSDIFPKKSGWTSELLNTYSKLESPGVLGCKLLFEDDSLQHAGMSYKKDISIGDMWVNIHPHKGMPDIDKSYIVKEVPAVTGACMLLEKKVYEEVGGLSENYILGDFEDSDLCLKLMKNSLKIYYTSKPELYHLERQSQSLFDDKTWKYKLTIFNCSQQMSKWDSTIQNIMESKDV